MVLEIPKPLIDDIKKGRASLFLGAGASQEAGFPSTKEISEYLINKSDKKYKEKILDKSFDDIAQFFYDEPGYGKNWVNKKIIEFFKKEHKKLKSPPSDAHHIITKIKWNTIFTTNYDRIIEISYENNSESIQDCLPIYEPDIKLRYREDNTIRLIKLHGSFDQASRKASHQLVITYNDMQNAKRINNQFYEILKEDAVNGSIIFIGYGFKLPGASNYLSSFEYEILSDLISEMGATSPWHYLIKPMDNDNDENERFVSNLARKNIKVINVSFGEFLTEINKILKSSVEQVIPSKITIPIGDAIFNYPVREYMKDKRFFNILHNELLEGKPPTPYSSLNGNDNWLSFYHNHFIERKSTNDILKEILDTSQDNKLIIINAPLGWGKTFLLKNLSIKLFNKKKPVIWLNPLAHTEKFDDDGKPIVIGRWETDRIISLFEHFIKSSKNYELPIIIADDSSDRIDELINLCENLEKSKFQFKLVISIDSEEIANVMDEYPYLKNSCIFNLNKVKDETEIERLVDFCFENDILKNQIDKQRIISNIELDEADKLLLFALQVIYDRNHRPFNKIVESFWNTLENDIQRDLVLTVASINRFGSYFSPRLYTITKLLNSTPMVKLIDNYQQCLKKEILFEKDIENEPCVFTLHPLIAEKYSLSYNNQGEIDDCLINLIGCMSQNIRDLELIRKISKLVRNHRSIILPNDKIEKLFDMANKVTNHDWVVSQQYSIFLMYQEKFPEAINVINDAINNNPKHVILYHTRGNIRKRWIERLLLEDTEKAEKQFELAGKDFSKSRMRYSPNEYGYVTNLDMIIQKIDNENIEQKIIDLKIEGKQLYEEGLQRIPPNKIQLLLNNKYKNVFEPDDKTQEAFLRKIGKSIKTGKPSVHSISFYAKRMYQKDNNNYSEMIEILKENQFKYQSGILLFLTEAELHINENMYSYAAKCLENAKRYASTTERYEFLHKLYQQDLLVSFILKDYTRASRAQNKLEQMKHFIKESYPIGYIWKLEAKYKDAEERELREDAKIYKGRFEDMKTGGFLGTIALNNDIGEVFYINFNPKYFKKSYRIGDTIKFVVTILPNRLRADDPEGNHWYHTNNDVFVKQT